MQDPTNNEQQMQDPLAHQSQVRIGLPEPHVGLCHRSVSWKQKFKHRRRFPIRPIPPDRSVRARRTGFSVCAAQLFEMLEPFVLLDRFTEFCFSK
jgi:hypothetical protein